jgi:excinuclease UvrABC nuclease subunit
MNISELVPQPRQCETFRRSRCRYLPEASGCYVLTTFSKVVLYIGLASNLQRRMNDHLGNLDKTRETTSGRAVLFYWTETEELNKVERTWMNIHIQHEGTLPELNKVFSPVSV